MPMHMVDAAVSLARLERLSRALGRVLGLPVEPVQTRSYERLAHSLDAGEIELAWLPPIAALRAARAGRAAPLVAPLRGGSASIHTALFALSSSKLTVESELGGARVAWVDRASAAGYAVVRAALRARGHELTKLFASESFEGSHQAVVQAVVEGTADVGATYVHRDAAGVMLSAGWGETPARIVFAHGPIPADVLAASTELEPAVALAIKSALIESKDEELTAAARELFEAEGFVGVDASHLEPLDAIIDHFDAT